MLNKIKSYIENLYMIELKEINIEDFLTKLPKDYPIDGGVFLEKKEEYLSISLGFSEKILEFIGYSTELTKKKSQKKIIKAKDFELLNTVIEEVSHFCYISWKYGYQNQPLQSVSRFELELQANIDTYLITTELMLRNNKIPLNLKENLFQKREIYEGHKKSWKEIYIKTRYYAESYTNYLDYIISNKNIKQAHNDLREFYRKGELAKKQHIINRRLS
jgi:hypothetical protein